MNFSHEKGHPVKLPSYVMSLTFYSTQKKVFLLGLLPGGVYYMSGWGEIGAV